MKNSSVHYTQNPAANYALLGALAQMLELPKEDLGHMVIAVVTRSDYHCKNEHCKGFHHIGVVSSIPVTFATVDILTHAIEAVEAAPIVNDWDDIRGD